MHKFVILLNSELKNYNSFEDIPLSFENLIEFNPHIPVGPHTEDEHELIDSWSCKLKELMKRENNGNNHANNNN